MGGGNLLPNAAQMPQDVAAFVPRGLYDVVQVYYTPGDNVPDGAWGGGPGVSLESNGALWTTADGLHPYGTTERWTSQENTEPFEVFIHEPMHGYDTYALERNVPVPNGLLLG